MRNVTYTVVLALVLAVPAAHAYELTFEERLEAQTAIERVYLSHRSGTTRSFERAVPQGVLREKVRTYLKQTVALEQYWNTSVTAEMLDRELERMIRQTLMPERLEELFAALGNDPLLIREGLARPALVNRLTRNFFRTDERIHEAATTTWDDWWQQHADAFDEAEVKTVARDTPLPQVFPAGTGPTEGGCPVADTWDNGSLSDALDGRIGHTAIWTGTEMIVWGGLGGHNSGDRYDPATDTWTQMSRVGAPMGRNLPLGVWTGSRMIVWGGEGSGATTFDTGGVYDPVTDSWAPLTTIGAPTGRGNATAIWTGSRMLVWGGGTVVTFENTGGQYDPATDTWTSLSLTNAPSGRINHTAVWSGSQMLIWGGNDGTGAVDTGGRYDPVSDTWTTLSTFGAPPPLDDHTAVWTGTHMLIWSRAGVVGGLYAPSVDAWGVDITDVNAPPPGEGHSAVWTGTEMVIWGGSDGGITLDSGGRYNPVTRQWTSTSLVNAAWGRGHTAVWTGSQMIVWGGGGRTGGRYDPVTDSWTPTSTGNGPPVHYDLTAVWTGNRMITWAVGDGEVYDPVLDFWTQISLINRPPVRFRHIAVWTGDEMLIWGGGLVEAGGRYDPVADSWAAMSVVGAPPSVPWPAGVWTGSDLIVWGGGYVGSETNAGGRYDPATDSWTMISLVDVPEPRLQPAAVWTGNEMIVWGGFRDNCCNTGGRYDPMTDTWQSTSLVGAPSARAQHPAVWTGSQMIVWGGSNTDTGGVYDPVTDSWTPTSLVNAPPPRNLHTALWTGRRMVVWGGMGSNGADVGSSGGLYDPATDSWTPTSLVDAPAPRREHAAIWTGTHMLIWGGGRSTGGRYALGDAIDDDGDGLSECAGDCNDGNANVFPGAAEICDGLDNDCGGAVDDLDFDLDGHGACAADCNDTDAGAFAFPPEIANLAFTDKVTLTWDSAAAAAGSATVHDIVIGLISEGPVGTGASETCLTVPAGGNTATHLAVPDPGECYRFVVRGRNSCGAGTYGAQSDGLPRSSAVCP